MLSFNLPVDHGNVTFWSFCMTGHYNNDKAKLFNALVITLRVSNKNITVIIAIWYWIIAIVFWNIVNNHKTFHTQIVNVMKLYCLLICGSSSYKIYKIRYLPPPDRSFQYEERYTTTFFETTSHLQVKTQNVHENSHKILLIGLSQQEITDNWHPCIGNYKISF